jgi:hypothetical protein
MLFCIPYLGGRKPILRHARPLIFVSIGIVAVSSGITSNVKLQHST